MFFATPLNQFISCFFSIPLLFYSAPGKVFLKLHNSFPSHVTFLLHLMIQQAIMIPPVFQHLPIVDKLLKSLEHCARKIAEQEVFCIFVSRSRVVMGNVILIFTAKNMHNDFLHLSSSESIKALFIYFYRPKNFIIFV